MGIFRRRLAGVLSVVGLVFFCVGCGQKEGSGEVVYTQPPSETYAALTTSSASKFSYADLVVGAVSRGSSEETVKAAFGEPLAVRDDDETQERTYFYDQMTLTFSKVQKEYELAGARVTGGSYAIARGLHVGDDAKEILRVFYRDENCLNHNFMSEDGETILGKFLYGDYTMDRLESHKTRENVQYGLIVYNGAASMESAEKLTYQYVSFEQPFAGETVTLNDDFAQLDIEVGQSGQIVEISWYYYEEIK